MARSDWIGWCAVATVLVAATLAPRGCAITPGGGGGEFAPEGSRQGSASVESVLNARLQLRWPVSVLVDMEALSLRATRQQWDAVKRLPDGSRFVVLPFNNSGVLASADPVEGAAGVRQALRVLQEEQEEPQQTGGVAFPKRGGNGFIALLHAVHRGTEDAPRDRRGRCVLLLFTGRPAADEEMAALAATQLTQAKCMLYVWWSGAGRFEGTGAERLYRDVALHTGGGFYTLEDDPTTNPTRGMETHGNAPSTSGWSQQAPTPDANQVILAARQGLAGLTTTPVPVDSSVRDLTVYILGHVSKANIRNPIGTTIYLLEKADGGDDDNDGNGLLELRLNTRGVPPGLWQLTADDGGSSTGAVAATPGARRGPAEGYDVIVKGTSDLIVDVQRSNGSWVDDNGDLVVTVQGEAHAPINNITDVVFLDHNGNELAKAAYNQRVRRDPQNREVYELVVPSTSLQQQRQPPHYVQVKGVSGASSDYKAFERITPQIPTTGNLLVTLDAHSNLTVQPGTQNHVFLEVTNNGNRPSRIYVYGSSAEKILYKIAPDKFQLNPMQKITIGLLLKVPSNTNTLGDIVKLQFQNELAISEVWLDIAFTNPLYMERDTSRPSFRHSILSNCKKVDICSSRQWSMEAVVQDTGSGIREISSQPQGIIWTPMMIGSKLPITLRYRASCCDENVVITVTDLQNNIAQHRININYDSGLSPGAIAGIAVGCVIILILIIVVISIIVCKNKKTHTFQTQQVPR